MKFGLIIFLFIFLSSMVLTSCILGINCEKGNGDIAKQTRDGKDFKNIVLEGSGNIYISQGNEESIVVESDENILPLIKTNVSGPTLFIGNENNICPTKLNVYITAKNLNALKISGSGNFFGRTSIKTDNIRFDIDGSGDIKGIDLSAETVSIKINGSGNVNLKGKTSNLNCLISGSGNIECYELQTTNTIVEVDGSGNCYVNAVDKLYVNIDGSGDVYYKGNPMDIKKVIKGSGKVVKK